ncbi:MAG: hypothetical protein MHM6MM_003276 [Cercozoa sp. M6MM]
MPKLTNEAQRRGEWQVLQPYVSRSVSRWLEVTPEEEALNLPTVHSWTTCALFADVSGFTALNERLLRRRERFNAFSDDTDYTDEEDDEHQRKALETLMIAFNKYTHHLVRLIRQWGGGDVLKWAGDAVLAVWPPVPSELLRHSDTSQVELRGRCVRAAATALKIQKELHKCVVLTKKQVPDLDEDIVLSVKIGLGVGRVSLCHVGGIRGRVEAVPVGSGIRFALGGEELCSAGGQVIAHHDFWELVRHACTGTPVDENGHMMLDKMTVELQPSTVATDAATLKRRARRRQEEKTKGVFKSHRKLEQAAAVVSVDEDDTTVSRYTGDGTERPKEQHRPSITSTDIQTGETDEGPGAEAWVPRSWQLAALKRYVPNTLLPYVALAARSGKHVMNWANQVRLVTSLFISLDVALHRVDTADEETLMTLQEVTTLTQEIVYDAEGDINKFLFDEKGSTIVAVFGAPPAMYKQPHERAVVTAVQLRDVFAARGIRCYIGVATGNAFIVGFAPGSVGGKLQKEYGIIGDCVNLSARLMSAAIKGAGRQAEQAAVNARRSRRQQFGAASGDVLFVPFLKYQYATAPRLRAQEEEDFVQQGGVLVASDTVRRVAERRAPCLEFVRTPPIKLKGKEIPVIPFAPWLLRTHMTRLQWNVQRRTLNCNVQDMLDEQKQREAATDVLSLRNLEADADTRSWSQRVVGYSHRMVATQMQAALGHAAMSNTRGRVFLLESNSGMGKSVVINDVIHRVKPHAHVLMATGGFVQSAFCVAPAFGQILWSALDALGYKRDAAHAAERAQPLVLRLTRKLRQEHLSTESLSVILGNIPDDVDTLTAEEAVRTVGILSGIPWLRDPLEKSNTGKAIESELISTQNRMARTILCADLVGFIVITSLIRQLAACAPVLICVDAGDHLSFFDWCMATVIGRRIKKHRMQTDTNCAVSLAVVMLTFFGKSRIHHKKMLEACGKTMDHDSNVMQEIATRRQLRRCASHDARLILRSWDVVTTKAYIQISFGAGSVDPELLACVYERCCGRPGWTQAVLAMLQRRGAVFVDAADTVRLSPAEALWGTVVRTPPSEVAAELSKWLSILETPRYAEVDSDGAHSVGDMLVLKTAATVAVEKQSLIFTFEEVCRALPKQSYSEKGKQITLEKPQESESVGQSAGDPRQKRQKLRLQRQQEKTQRTDAARLVDSALRFQVQLVNLSPLSKVEFWHVELLKALQGVQEASESKERGSEQEVQKRARQVWLREQLSSFVTSDSTQLCQARVLVQEKYEESGKKPASPKRVVKKTEAKAMPMPVQPMPEPEAIESTLVRQEEMPLVPSEGLPDASPTLISETSAVPMREKRMSSAETPMNTSSETPVAPVLPSDTPVVPVLPLSQVRQQREEENDEALPVLALEKKTRKKKAKKDKKEKRRRRLPPRWDMLGGGTKKSTGSNGNDDALQERATKDSKWDSVDIALCGNLLVWRNKQNDFAENALLIEHLTDMKYYVFHYRHQNVPVITLFELICRLEKTTELVLREVDRVTTIVHKGVQQLYDEILRAQEQLRLKRAALSKQVHMLQIAQRMALRGDRDIDLRGSAVDEVDEQTAKTHFVFRMGALRDLLFSTTLESQRERMRRAVLDFHREHELRAESSEEVTTVESESLV